MTNLNREYEQVEMEFNCLVSNWDWFEKNEEIIKKNGRLIIEK